MLLILAQRIDIDPIYDDIPFERYHFPERYKGQISKGDCFIYYQGNRHKKEHRYYYGCGVIGDIVHAPEPGHYYASITQGHKFENIVPIYDPDGTYYECIDYSDIRQNINPPWQSSIRKISDRAFDIILEKGGIDRKSIGF